MEVSIFKPLAMFAGEEDLREDLMGKSDREFVENAEFKLRLELFEDFLVLGIGIATGADFGCVAKYWLLLALAPLKPLVMLFERGCWSTLAVELARFWRLVELELAGESLPFLDCARAFCWACSNCDWTSLLIVLERFVSFFTSLPRNNQSTSPFETPGSRKFELRASVKSPGDSVDSKVSSFFSSSLSLRAEAIAV